MDKAQVIDKVGTPDSSVANGDTEMLEYRLYSDSFGGLANFGVILKDGKVLRYGSMDQLFPPSPAEIQARQARAARALQIMQMYRAPAAPDLPQVHIYQPQRPVQTHCQSMGYGNVDCTSTQTGVDTSIYNQ
jgi:hypothetical protein